MNKASGSDVLEAWPVWEAAGCLWAVISGKKVKLSERLTKDWGKSTPKRRKLRNSKSRGNNTRRISKSYKKEVCPWYQMHLALTSKVNMTSKNQSITISTRMSKKRSTSSSLKCTKMKRDAWRKNFTYSKRRRFSICKNSNGSETKNFPNTVALPRKDNLQCSRIDISF